MNVELTVSDVELIRDAYEGARDSVSLDELREGGNTGTVHGTVYCEVILGLRELLLRIGPAYGVDLINEED
jgi:hypothetical protein